jgi:hypothetical protein
MHSFVFKILSFYKGPEDGPLGSKLVARLKHYKKNCVVFDCIIYKSYN